MGVSLTHETDSKGNGGLCPATMYAEAASAAVLPK